jgi:hypothetical protein
LLNNQFHSGLRRNETSGLAAYDFNKVRADGSIMPRVITGNTMAPCIVIGERAAELLRTAHKLSRAGAYSNQTPFAQQTVPLSRGPQLATR